MKNPTFLITFVGTHLIFIFLIIYKYNLRVQLLYNKQKQEHLYHQLEEKKDQLTHYLSELKDQKTVKTFAEVALQMKPIALTQIKKIAIHE